MIQLSLTIDMAPGDAPEFMLRLSEAFKTLQGAVVKAMSPTPPTPAPTQYIPTTSAAVTPMPAAARGTVAPLPAPAEPDTPAETLPQPAAEAPAKAERKPRAPKAAAEPATPASAPAAGGDALEDMDDAALLVELRNVGNKLVKASGPEAVMSVLKSFKATRYGDLSTDDKRAALRKLNAAG